MGKITLIAAIGPNRELGYKNDLIYRSKEDMKHFTNITTDNVVLMGRLTWLSLPARFRPLPNRVNIVLSREVGATVYTIGDINGQITPADKFNFGDFLQQKKVSVGQWSDIMIIGGGQIYVQAMKYADEMYISHFDQEAQADVFFPKINVDEWNVRVIKKYQDFTIKHYVKKTYS